ncbi:hypothetical protein ABT354_08440 [Streptomyces sp. NPDC000594]|uniref:hypothetical protein n=1 Tax=Streptomyces sp. NPDC000594 TaxID=3154261 RepID=UPI003320B42F
MFGGIDEVDWAALGHAYGPADDVPELLRGLASGDPAEREAALDGMYGAVHHQGDVYDSTLACIPFLLELVADPAVQDRGGIVELLTSIGGIDLDGDDELDPEDEEFEFAANYAMASSAVTAGADVFLALVDSGDRGVRLSVPLALATLHSEPELVLRMLRDRLGVEHDPEVRFACVEAAGRIALRHSWLAAEVVRWLVELARVRHGSGAGTVAGGRPGAGLAGESGPDRPVPPRPDPWADGYDGWALLDPWCIPDGVAELTGPWDDPGDPPGPSNRRDPDSFPGPRTPESTPRPSLGGVPSPTAPQDRAIAPTPVSAQGSTRGDDRESGDSGPSGGSDDEPRPPDEPHGGGPRAEEPRTEEPRPSDEPRTDDAGLRLSALAQLARCAPHALPADIVPGVLGLLRELRAGQPGPSAGHGPPPEPPEGPQGDPDDREDDGGTTRHALWTGDLLRTLHSGLGDRVADRTALLTDQLCSPDWGQRIDAVRMSSALLRTRRGEYGELVALIGEQLSDKEPRLADAAAAALGELFSLAAPAADALAEFVAADPGCWVQEWASGPRTLGCAVAALARTGDARAVPVLGRILELPQAPHDLGYALDHLGPVAAPLAPALRARLAGTGLDDRLYDTAGPLLYGLTALRTAEALPEVLRVLRGAPEYRREWVVELALGALTAFGPAAGEAAPELRALLARSRRTGGHGGAFAVRVAGALWAVGRDPDAVLPVLRTTLASDTGARRAAAGVLGTMGPAAWEAVPELRLALRAADPGTRVDAALALWRVTGAAEPAWPVLRTAWETLPFTRMPTAERLAERAAGPGSGPVAASAEGAAGLIHAELSRVRRHNAVDGGYGSHDIVRDERLLALCRHALTAEGGETRTAGETGERPTS